MKRLYHALWAKYHTAFARHLQRQGFAALAQDEWWKAEYHQEKTVSS